MVSLLHCSLILSFFICIIISFRPAWLARALLSFKRAQSSGNDDADEGQKTPFESSPSDKVQAISDADEGQKTPFESLMIIYARVTHLSFRRLLIQQ